jgi:glutamate formiminotransferase / 5-formyltetrahydrofolate cyclo-ligase
MPNRLPPPDPLPLLAVPNVSEGRDLATLDAIQASFTAGGASRLLDRHADADHHRAVFTLTGASGAMADALLAGAREAVARIDVAADAARGRRRGEHPHVGALDVVPLVYLDPAMRGAACAQALVVADRIGAELGVPVFLYGALAGGRTRAQLRRGGVAGLRARMAGGEQRPDYGPPALHPTAGATLVAAREPLVAFNVELASPATVQQARQIAALIREGGPEGLPGLRAIGVQLRPASGAPVAQVSMNVERPLELTLREVVEAIRRHAPVAAAELVGLAPRAALVGFPEDVPMPAFDPERQVIENAAARHAPARAERAQ